MKHASSGLVFLTSIFALFLAAPQAVLAYTFDNPPPGFTIETMLGGLDAPTSFVFAPDGSVFIAQKGGIVLRAKDGALLPTPVIILPKVNNYGDRGLLSIALDPSFNSKRYLYLLYTYENNPSDEAGPKTAQLIRVTLDANYVAVPGSTLVLLGKTVGDPSHPSCESYAASADCISSDSTSHSVADIKFAPDGKLFVSIGDGASFDYADTLAFRAQDVNRLNGKVLRINPANGQGYRDNPFYRTSLKNNRSKVWDLGLRNPFRLTFRPSNGTLFIGDVGWYSFEEVNVGNKGVNFGWPCREGFGATPEYPVPGKTCATSGYTNPIFTYPHNPDTGSGAIIGGLFYDGDAYPEEYHGSFFYADFSENFIKRLVIDDNNALVSAEDFIDDAGGPVAFAEDENHDIYYLSIYTGELRKISYTGAANRPPVVHLGAQPTSGVTPLTVNFTASASSDPDNNPITFLWNFGDGTTSTQANPVHVYKNNIDTNATLTVSDNHGASASQSIRIVSGNKAPVATIQSPANNSTYLINQAVSLTGLGVDNEDGTLPESAYSWKLILHHNVHTHILDSLSGSHPTFTAPDHGPDPDVYLEVELDVTDSIGLVGSSSISMRLQQSGGGSCTTSHVTAVSDFSDVVSSGAKAVAAFKDKDWTVNIPGAAWIWGTYYVTDPYNGGVETFTKNINVSGTVSAASIVIGADDYYEATLNGTQFAQVTELNNFTSGKEDTYDLSKILHTGANTLKVTVHNAATHDTNPEANGAGLLYKFDATQSVCTP